MARGKVILFGEHAVVYGQAAVAAALDLGIVAIGRRPAPRLAIHLLDSRLTAERLDGTRLGDALDRLASCLEADLGDVTGLHLDLDSQLPIGAGLGSSAALAVAIAEAILAPLDLPDPRRLALTLDAARAFELVFHGNPSGIDHTTAACGGMLLYRRHHEPPFLPLDDIPPLALTVAQLGPGADTGAMVAAVRALRDAEPASVDPLIAWLGQLTLRAVDTLRAGELTATGRLMNLAHGGLVALGVSTDALDRGCHAARDAGAWGAKLTGAGGGGCMIALGPPDRADAIAAALANAGALRVLSTMAGVR